MTERRPVGFGRRTEDAAADAERPAKAVPDGAVLLDDDTMRAAHPGAREARPQGLVRQAARDRGLARLRGRGAARVPRGRAAPAPGS